MSLSWLLLFSIVGVAVGLDVYVSDTQGLLDAVAQAQAGHTIVLEAGVYFYGKQNIECRAAGKENAPITVKSRALGAVEIIFNSDDAPYTEGFYVRKPFWIFENLMIRGNCSVAKQCDHAWHLAEESHHAVIRNNRASNFNTIIKTSGGPNFGLIEYNELFNTIVRPERQGYLITVQNGEGWRVRRNYLHDLGGTKGTSYGAQITLGSTKGVFEGNFVCCQCNPDLQANGPYIGLAFYNEQATTNSNCSMINNIVMNCNDVGLYIASSANTRVLHNTLYNTVGIDMRFSKTTGEVANNIYSGRIKPRGSATYISSNNLELSTDKMKQHYFADPENGDFSFRHNLTAIDSVLYRTFVPSDFCGYPRREITSVGAIEFNSSTPCNNQIAPWFKPERPKEPTTADAPTGVSCNDLQPLNGVKCDTFGDVRNPEKEVEVPNDYIIITGRFELNETSIVVVLDNGTIIVVGSLSLQGTLVIVVTYLPFNHTILVYNQYDGSTFDNITVQLNGTQAKCPLNVEAIYTPKYMQVIVTEWSCGLALWMVVLSSVLGGIFIMVVIATCLGTLYIYSQRQCIKKKRKIAKAGMIATVVGPVPFEDDIEDQATASE